MGMRGLETPVRKIRRQVFREVSKVAFESTSENLIEEIEEIPYRPVSYTHLVDGGRVCGRTFQIARRICSDRVDPAKRC